MADEKGMTIMSDFAAKVKEKVKRDFAGMIPEDAWDRLVEDAVQSFIKDDLEKLVKEELRTECAARLKKFFETPEWTDQWDSVRGGNARLASERVRELMKEHTTDIVNAVMGSAYQSVINDLRNQLSRGY